MGNCLRSPCNDPQRSLPSSPTRTLASTTVFTTARSQFSEMLPSEGLGDYAKIKDFTFADLKQATGNFKAENLLGEEVSGKVFKGWLDIPSKPGSGMAVAIKRLIPESMERFEQWRWEASLLEALSHPNLIKLLGYCREDKELLLVYEFMQKGTLENSLFGENPAIEPISWNIRLKIAIQAAKGLAFLHLKHIICADFTLSNILLDGDYNAKILDFGLASLEHHGGYSNAQMVYGYAPPEYMNGHLSVKSDVYGFGVVLLQMITGLKAVDRKRPFGQKNIVEQLKPSLSSVGKLKSIVDARMEGQYSSTAMWLASQITLKCLNTNPGLRPHMEEVVKSLEQIECME